MILQNLLKCLSIRSKDIKTVLFPQNEKKLCVDDKVFCNTQNMMKIIVVYALKLMLYAFVNVIFAVKPVIFVKSFPFPFFII